MPPRRAWRASPRRSRARWIAPSVRRSGRVHVVLVNQSDQPNGWATPVPYNLIEITAAGPSGESLIGNTDDWLRLVFTHEYTHIVHLGRSAGWIGGLRRVFGRNPALFPNLTQPLWAIEGIATFEESAATGRGRVNAGDFRQIVTRAAASGRFEPLDRAGGGLDDWPGGNAQYAYGGLFHRFLADTYGEPSLRRLTDETGRRLPYFGFPAYRKVFGKSLGALWSDFEADARSRSRRGAVRRAAAHPSRLHASPGRASRRTGGSITRSSTRRLSGADGARARRGRAPAGRERYLGERTSVTGDLLVFDQVEIAANVGRRARPLRARRSAATSHAPDAPACGRRPDVSPDGTRVVFTIQRERPP